jgi:hypothetical protein
VGILGADVWNFGYFRMRGPSDLYCKLMAESGCGKGNLNHQPASLTAFLGLWLGQSRSIAGAHTHPVSRTGRNLRRIAGEPVKLPIQHACLEKVCVEYLGRDTRRQSDYGPLTKSRSMLASERLKANNDFRMR